MSEEIIARIEAPRANPDLVGHELAERAMHAAWRSGRLAHGWLIGGPSGVGKATLAWRFARFVLAGGQTPGADHPVFRQLAAGAHPDCRLVRRSYDMKRSPPRFRGEIVVDDVRALAGFLRHTPAVGGWRVAIVDAADEMNPNAANALLKMLEEPPSRTLLLLVAHTPARLLPTLRSRCRRLVLRPLAEEQVAPVLAARCPGLARDDMAALARLAEGCPGRAAALADAGGLDLYREMVALLEPLPALDMAALHGAAERFGRGAAGEAAFRIVTGLLRRWLGAVIRCRAAGAAPAEIVPGEAAVMARLAGRGGLDRWLAVWEKTEGLFARADSLNLDRRQVFLNAVFALAETTRG